MKMPGPRFLWSTRLFGSVAVRLLLMVGALLLGAIGAIGTYTAYDHLEDVRRDLIGNAQSDARQIASVTANWLLVKDLVAIERLLLELVDGPHVLGAIVTDTTGNVLVQVRQSPVGPPRAIFGEKPVTPPSVIAAAAEAGDDEAKVWQPVASGGESIGWVRVRYSLAAAQADKHTILVRTAVAGFVVLVVMLGLLVVALRRPLGILGEATRFARALSSRRGEQRPINPSATELVELQRALNDVSRELYERDLRLAERERSLSTLLSNLTGMVYRCRNDRDWTMEFASSGAQALTGYAPEDFLNRKIAYADLIHLDDRDKVWDNVQAAVAGRRAFQLRYRIRAAGGQEKWVWEQGQGIFSASGEVLALEGYVADVTALHQAEEQAGMLASAIEQTADSVIITSREGVIEYVNPAFEQITGYARAEALGKKPNLVKSGMHDQAFYRRLWQTIRGGQPFREVFINRSKDGALYHEEKTITPIKDEHGNITHFVSTGKDITERKQAEERLSYLAHYDTLTGLPNRQLLHDRLRQTMIEAGRNERVAAVMLLDLDRFKFINDSLGHEAGDLLLKSVAERLTACVRHGDTVARLGGDEFTLVLANVARVDDVILVTQKILESFKQPFTIIGRELFVSPSIGITLYPHDDRDIDGLLKNADVAMYHAKESGRNTFQFFTAELNVRAAQRLELETALRHALERNEFVLHYQPLMDMSTGQLKGVEALLRWRHPVGGLVAPLDFIPLAEETGLIVPIGEWVLRTACAQAKAWHAAGFCGLQMAVNISSRQFQQKNLAAMIHTVLAETGLEPQCFNLELTESVLMHNIEAAAGIMGELDAAGVGFSIDDFGTGYSSLSYLKRFPIDVLKIDRSFVRDISSDPEDAAIVTAIMAMARSLKIEVVAEGVETQEQLDFLRARGCDLMQGYYFSKPLDAEALTALLKQTMKKGSCKPRADRRLKSVPDTH